ncbi:MAG: 3-hydroxyacyl-CoA dehydrogenase family protein [Balneolaceae bacterium]
MKNVAVIGGGTMGNGIAHIFALNGFNVQLAETEQELADRAVEIIRNNLERMVNKEKITENQKAETLGRITTSTKLEQAVSEAQLVIEAVPESFMIKKDVFETIDKHAPSDKILASNTSSISITKLAAVTTKPENFIGMHFFNPVPVMKLVEIVKGFETSDEVAEIISNTAKKLGKVPVEVHDYPGFVSNRVLMPMINEAIFCVHEGVAAPEDVDEVMKLGMAHPMGPLRLADFIGLDVCLDILKVLNEGFKDPKYRPCPLLVKMVDAGKLGDKTGEGFYKY